MDTLAHIDELEAIAQVMQQKAVECLNYCHRQRKKLGTVSTAPNARKGLTAVEQVNLQTKLKKKFQKKLASA